MEFATTNGSSTRNSSNYGRQKTRRNLFRSRNSANGQTQTPRGRSRSPTDRGSALYAPKSAPSRRSIMHNFSSLQHSKNVDSAGDSSELTPTSSPLTKKLAKPRRLDWAELYLQDSDDDDLFDFTISSKSSHVKIDEDTLTSTPSKENKAIHANSPRKLSNPPEFKATDNVKCEVFKAPNNEMANNLVKGSSGKHYNASTSAPSAPSATLAAMETDMAVLRRRQKQIDYGKNTIGYQTYINLIPKDKRGKKDPSTPNKFGKYARRSWDSMIRVWRMKLHSFDPVDEDFNDNTELSEIFSDLSFDSKMFSSSPSRSSPVSSISCMPSSPIQFSVDDFPVLPSSELGDFGTSELDQQGADLLAEMDEADFLSSN